DQIGPGERDKHLCGASRYFEHDEPSPAVASPAASILILCNTFIALNIKHKDCGATYLNLDRAWHVEFGRLQDRHQRIHVVGTGVAMLARDANHVRQVCLLNAQEQRHVAFPEETTGAVNLCRVKSAISKSANEPVGISS